MLRDPAAAVAVSKCLLSRLFPAENKLRLVSEGGEPYHPDPCAWEEWSTEDLKAMLEEFNVLSEYRPNFDTFGNVKVQAFHRLPAHDQSRRVRAAQYPTEAVA